MKLSLCQLWLQSAEFARPKFRVLSSRLSFGDVNISVPCECKLGGLSDSMAVQNVRRKFEQQEGSNLQSVDCCAVLCAVNVACIGEYTNRHHSFEENTDWSTPVCQAYR